MDTLQTWRSPLILFAAIGCALSAGIFFTFSTFVMQALSEQPSASGISTMQSINITVINPWFIAAFFLPAVASFALTVLVLKDWNQPSSIYLLAGTLLYLVGTIGVTVAGNIPLNDALAAVQPDSIEGAALWTKFLSEWTLWNHVRTGAGLLAAISFVIAL
ncbi:MAG: anthrone oxygenase family protein [Cyanobacteria bacterium P01_C01_bin.89]